MARCSMGIFALLPMKRKCGGLKKKQQTKNLMDWKTKPDSIETKELVQRGLFVHSPPGCYVYPFFTHPAFHFFINICSIIRKKLFFSRYFL